MVLVDSSVWVNYLNHGEDASANALEDLIKAYEVAICPPIFREILQGIKQDKAYSSVKSILENVHLLRHNPYQMAEDAAQLYRALRRKGVTLKSTGDVVIAAYAMASNISILTLDSDFSVIAENSTLEIYPF